MTRRFGPSAPPAVNDHVWHRHGRFELSVPAIAFLWKSAQPLCNVADAVVLNVDIVIRELFTQIHGESRCDAAFAQIVHQQVAVPVKQALQRALKPFPHLIPVHVPSIATDWPARAPDPAISPAAAQWSPPTAH